MWVMPQGLFLHDENQHQVYNQVMQEEHVDEEDSDGDSDDELAEKENLTFQLEHASSPERQAALEALDSHRATRKANKKKRAAKQQEKIEEKLQIEINKVVSTAE